MLGQDSWSNLGILLDQLEDRVGQHIWSAGRKVHEGLEAWVRLAQHTVSISRNNTARVQSGPEIVSDVLVCEVVSDLLPHVKDPAKHFLGGEAVQRTSKTHQTRAVAEERVAEGAANQVGGVGRDISALVVSVQGEIQSQQVVEVCVLLATLAKQHCEVVGPVLVGVQDLGTDRVDLIRTEDESSDTRDLSQQRDAVFESWLPVVGLAETLLVGLCKHGLRIQSTHSYGELGHGVHVLGKRLDQVQNMLWQMRLLGQLAREGPNLGGRGDLARQQQPEHGLWEHLRARGALGKLSLAVLDGPAVEADALLRVQDGALPEHGLEATHSSDDMGDLEVSNDFITTLLGLFQQLAFFRNDLLERGLEVGLRSRVVAGVDC